MPAREPPIMPPRVEWESAVVVGSDVVVVVAEGGVLVTFPMVSGLG